MSALAAHQSVRVLDSVDAVAFGDDVRQWIIFSDRLTPVQRAMLAPHIEAALGAPDGVRGLVIAQGFAARMELAPYGDETPLPADGPGDFDGRRAGVPGI